MERILVDSLWILRETFNHNGIAFHLHSSPFVEWLDHSSSILMSSNDGILHFNSWCWSHDPTLVGNLIVYHDYMVIEPKL
jgi:hypothetical protein